MSCLILDPQMLSRYFIFCFIALLMLLDCSRDETIFDNGWSAANDNCTAIPSVTVPLGRSCFILVWCSVGTLHQFLCPLCSGCWFAPGVEHCWKSGGCWLFLMSLPYAILPSVTVPHMHCLILDTCRAGRLPHLQCHSIFSCHWIVQVVCYRIGETMYGVWNKVV